MKAVFVILHYCLPRVTEDCVSSLLRLNGSKEIIIVDNASPDGSGKELQKLYEHQPLVHVLLNNINGGFSDGNNLGYRYAKEKLKPDCMVVMNNDTIIGDIDFISKLNNENDLNKYHIIAPDILTFKGKHQNPYRIHGLSRTQVADTLRKKRLSLLFYSLPLLYKLKKKEGEGANKTYFEANRVDNIVPHGSAVIFTRQWIEKEDFAFYPGTFMYYEEDLLYLYARRKGYKILYNPNIQITHLEDMSTNHIHKNYRKNVVFQDRMKIKSLKVILNFIDTQNEK